MKRVIVLGAGVVGVSSAYALARRGWDVTVVDRAQEPGTGGATARNGAQLSYSYSDAFASPALLAQLPGLLLGRDRSHRIKLDLSIDFLRWASKVLSNTSRRRFGANTVATLQLALESRLAIHELMERHPFEFGFRRSRKLHLYRTRLALEKACSIVSLKQDFGLGQEVLSPEQVVEIEPCLANLGVPLAGAVLSPIDESGDAHLFARQLAGVTRKQHGARFHLGTDVRRINVSRGTVASVETTDGAMDADTVLVAMGAETNTILKPLGISVPIWPVRGYSVTLPAIDTSPLINVTEAAAKLVFSHLGTTMRIAGIADVGVAGHEQVEQRTRDLIDIARRVLPKAADYSGDPAAWSGLRPMTPSSQPVIGPTRIPGLYLNCGQGMLGWTLAMGSAERLAGWMGSSR